MALDASIPVFCENVSKLQEFRHERAGRRLAPLERRRIVCEYVKGLAAKTRSGRLILFIDEAQKLELVELGWLADLFNELQKDGFDLVVFLVGSYHLQKWKNELRGKEHEHVRSRFFAKECRLSGLSEYEDFRRCLRRYDVDASPFAGKQSITPPRMGAEASPRGCQFHHESVALLEQVVFHRMELHKYHYYSRFQNHGAFRLEPGCPML